MVPPSTLPQRFEFPTHAIENQYKNRADDVICCAGPEATIAHKPVLIFPHLCNPPVHIRLNHGTKDSHPKLSTLPKLVIQRTTPSSCTYPLVLI